MSSSSPRIVIAIGTLPPRRDQSGIFVANLLSLFFGNEKQTEDLGREVGRLESYGGRLLPILDLLFDGKAPNHVVLEQAPDANLLRYFGQELGLRLPEIHILPHRKFLDFAHSPSPESSAPLIARLQSTEPGWVDGFVTDDALSGLARRIGHATLNSRDSSYDGNHKVALHRFLCANSLPTFDTELAATRAEISTALARLRQRGYPRAVVKTAIGASGIGIWQLATSDSPAHLPTYLFHDGPCLVQGWLDAQAPGVDAVHSPSVQLCLNDDTVYLYDLTDQILTDASVHQGNLSPPPWLPPGESARTEILRQASLVGEWLHGKNYRGTASIDFHVTVRRGQPEIRVCEVNARVTGATYPALLAHHFTPGGAWLMRNIRFDPSVSSSLILSRLRRHDLLFLRGRSTGVIPINFNNLPDGSVAKGQFLCLAPVPAAASTLLERVQALLPHHDASDRD